jgi:hypothetical protein
MNAIDDYSLKRHGLSAENMYIGCLIFSLNIV